MISAETKRVLQFHINEDYDTYINMTGGRVIHLAVDDELYSLRKAFYYYRLPIVEPLNPDSKARIAKDAMKTLPEHVIPFHLEFKEGYRVERLYNEAVAIIHCLEAS